MRGLPADVPEVSRKRPPGRVAQSEAGFTLIELVITLALMMVVLTAVSASLASGSKSEVNVQKRLQGQADARQALVKMREDLHCAYAVQSIGPNAYGGFSMAVTEFYNTCAAVDQNTAGSSQVYLQWCTIPVSGKPGVFALYRENNTCDSSGTLMASDVVAPSGGWPTNSAVSPAPANWVGNLWPTSLVTCSSASQNGYLQTQAVDMAFNADQADSPSSVYELKDEISLRNSTRCGTSGGTLASPMLSLNAPAAGTVGTAVTPSSLTATLTGGSSPTGQITYTVFGPQASAPSSCASGGTIVGTATVTANNSYNPSQGFTPASGGTYWWYASYSGDSGNNGANSGCGSGMASSVVTSSKASPSLTVAAPASGTTGVAIPGSSLTATLSGGSSPTGTITVYAFGPSASAPSSCPGGAGWTTIGSVTAAGNGAYGPSGSLSSPSAGTYWWYAAYAGDSANNTSSSTCSGSMSSTNVQAGPTLSSLVMNDVNGDGKIDQLVASFSSTLAACSGSCATAGWTLSGVPSGGSLTSVAVSGNKATLTLSPGSGAADTSVGTFTAALSTAAGLKDTSGRLASFAAQAPTDGAGPVPVSITSANKASGTAGKAEAGDTITLTFSEPLQASTVPTKANVVMTAGSGNGGAVTVSIPGISGSAFQIGKTTKYMGKNSGAATFSNSNVVVSGSQVTITLTAPSGGSLTVGSYVAGATGSFAPASTIQDGSGNAAGGSLAIGVGFF